MLVDSPWSDQKRRGTERFVCIEIQKHTLQLGFVSPFTEQERTQCRSTEIQSYLFKVCLMKGLFCNIFGVDLQKLARQEE
jgi:hypothetical protein